MTEKFLREVYLVGVEKALRGLSDAFLWDHSPQGSLAWENVVTALREIKDAKVGFDGGETHGIVLNQTRPAEIAPKELPCYVNLTAIDDAIVGLHTAFTWSASPQGHEAWENVVLALREIKWAKKKALQKRARR